MCVIMSKPKGVAFPEESILRNCWDNNPDMGGFMYAKGGKVVIRKGYKTFDSFMKALNNARSVAGDDTPFVCHFRISTQGFDVSCCQPFPLSSKMALLKKKKGEANIGVAHNGVLSLTSDGSKTYSDTMKFVTDFLVNIIRTYKWYEDDRTVKLIENLIEGSRFAILDKNGHCELLGNGWVYDEDTDCYFSNSSYSYKKVVWNGWKEGYCGCYGYDDGYDDGFFDDLVWDSVSKSYVHAGNKQSSVLSTGVQEEDTEAFYWNKYKSQDGSYYFPADAYGDICPMTAEDDDSYCCKCAKYNTCSYIKACKNAV